MYDFNRKMFYFEAMKFLVIQQKMIGDVLTATLICENLRRHFPGCHIDFVANENTLAVIEGNPYLDKIIVFRKEYRSNKRAFFAFLRSFTTETYDALIDAYGKTESNLITWFTLAPMKISYYKWYTRFLYTHALKRYTAPDPELGLAVKNRLLLLQPLMSGDTSLVTRPSIYLSEAEIAEARDFLIHHHIDIDRPLFMLSVLGSGIPKTYPLPYMAEVIRCIAEQSEATLLFNYIPQQAAHAKTLYDLCDEATQARIKFGVFAPSLRKFLGVLYHCNALIGNEGGAVNMAKALRIPTFSIFSPWIAKEAWHLFAGDNTVAVHLRDYEPELFQERSPKQIKKKAMYLYERFKPSYIKKDLERFLETIST